MSKFQAFLKGNVKRIKTKKVFISDAFVNEEGELQPFVIRTIPTPVIEALQKECTLIDENGKTDFDTVKFNKRTIIEGLVVPDLKDKELQDSYEVIGEEALLNEMLLYGESNKLVKEINQLNGFKNINEKIDEVKN